MPGLSAALRLCRTGIETPCGLWVRCGTSVTEEDDEAGDFLDRPDSVIRHLARLLIEPNRRFSALEFYPPPPGAAPLPYLGRDKSSDKKALEDEEKKLRQLSQEIKDAEDDHDTELAERLKAEFYVLMEHVERERRARKRGRAKRCGTPSPSEKADQNLRVRFGDFKKRLTVKGLPKLAEHLDEYIDNADGVWMYAPPPGTSTWQVTRPDPCPEK